MIPAALITSSWDSSRANAGAAGLGSFPVWITVRCSAVTVQPSRWPLPIGTASTTSSSQRAGFPVSAGVWCASMPVIWSARTSPSPKVCNHTRLSPIVLLQASADSLMNLHRTVKISDKMRGK